MSRDIAHLSRTSLPREAKPYVQVDVGAVFGSVCRVSATGYAWVLREAFETADGGLRAMGAALAGVAPTPVTIRVDCPARSQDAGRPQRAASARQAIRHAPPEEWENMSRRCPLAGGRRGLSRPRQLTTRMASRGMAMTMVSNHGATTTSTPVTRQRGPSPAHAERPSRRTPAAGRSGLPRPVVERLTS